LVRRNRQREGGAAEEAKGRSKGKQANEETQALNSQMNTH